jgi:pimeloyl-ACP methyl ester carboxylesterase
MTQRAPIHLGSGEPMLLLHPFVLSQNVWKRVAPLIADTGRYEVFAPTMAGHNGGVRGNILLDIATLADDVERRMDALGWRTAHVVGNSLGGWVAFELERRGRVRTLTAIAPGGGWNHFTPAKFEIVLKFLLGVPLFVVCRLLGKRAAKFPFARQLTYPAISATADGITNEDIVEIVDDVKHCSAYYQMLVKSLALPGLLELGKTRIPTQLAICEKDRVLPTPRYTRQFTEQLPLNTVITTLDGVGHVPMYEAPQRIADVITGFVDEYADGRQATG